VLTSAFKVQWKLIITRSFGPRNFALYIRYFVISVANKQYKTKETNSLGPENSACYIRHFFISDLFISSFHCIMNIYLDRHIEELSWPSGLRRRYSRCTIDRLTFLCGFEASRDSCALWQGTSSSLPSLSEET